MDADIVFYGGPIYTVDPDTPTAEAVAVAEGIIVAVDAEAKTLKGSKTRVVNLKGRALIPGFYDAHQHQVTRGLTLTQINPVVDSIATLLARINDRAKREPAGTWLQGHGYDDAILGRHPTREDLDKAAPAHPTFIVRTCSHMLVANSMALARAGITTRTPDPPGGIIDRDDSGEPTGLLREAAMAYVRRVVPSPTDNEIKQAIVTASQANLAAGVTSVWEAALEPYQLQAYLELESENRLPVRMSVALRRFGSDGGRIPLPRPWRRPWLSMSGVKLIIDGAIGPRTAAISTGYVGEPDNEGLLMFEPDELYSEVREINAAGLQVSFHAIGDRAIEAALDSLDSLAPDGASRRQLIDSRPRIEHCGIATPSLQKRFWEAGVVAVVQPPFLRYQGETWVRNLGDENCRWAYPIASLLRTCRAVAGSSDSPVVPDCRPLQGMQIAMVRQTLAGRTLVSDERIGLIDALSLYTRGAAVAAKEEDVKGTIAVGKMADLVVLGDDPRRVATEDLENIPIDMVFLDGKEVA